MTASLHLARIPNTRIEQAERAAKPMWPIKNGQKVLVIRRKVVILLILKPQIATIRDPLIPHILPSNENTSDRRKLENEWLI